MSVWQGALPLHVIKVENNIVKGAMMARYRLCESAHRRSMVVIVLFVVCRLVDVMSCKQATEIVL